MALREQMSTEIDRPEINDHGLLASSRRVSAMIRRYWYLIKGSWPRILELAYWPTMQVVLWGFVTKFFLTQSDWLSLAVGVLLGGAMLWDVMFRGQISLSICFFEEMWSRNLGHLFVSPLRPWEFIFALITMSLLRTLFGLIVAAIIAFFLHRYAITEMGPSLVVFFGLLMVMSWGLGLVIISMVLRFGLGAESLAWAAVFAFLPISAVYYPVEVLPWWLQPLALATPAAHVFEGMRELLIKGVFNWQHFFWAAGLAFTYLGIGIVTFRSAFRSARAEGKLLQIGE